MFKLLRVHQWYKNLVIFLPLLFVGLASDFNSLFLVSLGFVVLCLMSSVNYIINDVIDMNKDKIHPIKRLRPIASGKISIGIAAFVACILAASALVLSNYLSMGFFYLLLGFFGFGQVYSLVLKKQLFLDIIGISINFVTRAVSGALILGVFVSPWLILCTFFLALFLAVGKRKSEINILKSKAVKHKEVLKYYTPTITNSLLTLSTTLLIVSYSLYSFSSIYNTLIITLPVALYVILRYFYLIESTSLIAGNPEKFYQDKPLVLGILFWIGIVFIIIYSKAL